MTRPTPQTSNPYQLYLVTDDQQDLTTLMHVVAEAVQGGVTMVQLREKHGDIRVFIERANALKAILAGTGVPLIINDRVDVALAVDADGVHLGQSDMPAVIARQLIGPDKILGLSIESPQQLAEAQQLDLDYIGLSAIFATPTKTNTSMHWGLDGLVDTLQKQRCQWWQLVELIRGIFGKWRLLECMALRWFQRSAMRMIRVCRRGGLLRRCWVELSVRKLWMP